MNLSAFSSHYPTTKFTVVSDTPENLRLAKQSKQQSQVREIHQVETTWGNHVTSNHFQERFHIFLVNFGPQLVFFDRYWTTK